MPKNRKRRSPKLLPDTSHKRTSNHKPNTHDRQASRIHQMPAQECPYGRLHHRRNRHNQPSTNTLRQPTLRHNKRNKTHMDLEANLQVLKGLLQLNPILLIHKSQKLVLNSALQYCSFDGISQRILRVVLPQHLAKYVPFHVSKLQ